jgi:hypothetical protein
MLPDLEGGDAICHPASVLSHLTAVDAWRISSIRRMACRAFSALAISYLGTISAE